MSAANFFTDEQKQKIVSAIAQAELNTSGEIRVHVQNRCRGDVLTATKKMFAQMQMHKTKDRNGVLFFVAVKDKKLAVWSDEGINNKVDENFWNNITRQMEFDFKQGYFAEGLSKAIIAAGEQLKKYFPYHTADTDELSNEISFK